LVAEELIIATKSPREKDKKQAMPALCSLCVYSAKKVQIDFYLLKG
jgi:hypothetical protein